MNIKQDGGAFQSSNIISVYWKIQTELCDLLVINVIKILDVQCISAIQKHINTDQHREANIVWHMLNSKIPRKAYFPQPGLESEFPKPKEMELKDPFTNGNNLYLDSENKLKGTIRKSSFEMYNKVNQLMNIWREIKNINPSLKKGFESLYKFCQDYTRGFRNKANPYAKVLKDSKIFENETTPTEAEVDDKENNDKIAEAIKLNSNQIPIIMDEDAIKLRAFRKHLSDTGKEWLLQYCDNFARVLSEIKGIGYARLPFKDKIFRYYNSVMWTWGAPKYNAYCASINYYFKHIRHTNFILKSKKVDGVQNRPFLGPDVCSTQNLQKWLLRSKKLDSVYDAAILARYMGLRIREIMQISHKDITVHAKNSVPSEASVVVYGKKGKTVVCETSVDECLEILNKIKNKQLKSIDPVLNNAENITPELLKKRSKNVSRSIEYRIAAKNDTTKMGAHSLRRTFAADLYERGVPTVIIAQLLRHSSIKDSLKYIGELTIEGDTKKRLKEFATKRNFYENYTQPVSCDKPGFIDVLNLCSDDDNWFAAEISKTKSRGSNKIQKVGYDVLSNKVVSSFNLDDCNKFNEFNDDDDNDVPALKSKKKREIKANRKSKSVIKSK